MMKHHKRMTIGFLSLVLVAVFSAGTAFPQAPATALKLAPDQVVISPDLMKNPVVFTGSGFGPNEIVNCWNTTPQGATIAYDDLAGGNLLQPCNETQ